MNNLDRNETLHVLAYLKGAYPNWGRSLSNDDAKAMVAVWFDMLGEYNVNLIKSAVQGMLATNEYPPTIAEVIKKIQLIQCKEQPMSEIQAWGLVKKALSNSTYNSKSEFEKLPQVIQNTIGTHDTLRGWALEECENMDKVTGSNFMRSYKSTVQREREFNSMPSDVKALIDGGIKKMIE